jgi:UDPglucose--hexose-1-phosphate uridylyltransferase
MAEFRRDPITGRWVLLAPERTRRSRDFTPPSAKQLDPANCPFCEGRESIAGHELLSWRTHGTPADSPGWDVHEVIIESPRHTATWSTLAPEEIWRTLWAWRERIRDLKKDVRLNSFVIIKNHGIAAGAKQDHAHSQLFAYPFAPPALELELASAMKHYIAEKRCLFCDVMQQEIDANQRVIAADDQTVILSPYAPRLPFETWLLPREHASNFEDSSDTLLSALAARLHDLVLRLDSLLLYPPFNLVLHTAPVKDELRPLYHWHLEIVPRLGPRSGVEWGSGVYVNPVTPEEAAHELRAG